MLLGEEYRYERIAVGSNKHFLRPLGWLAGIAKQRCFLSENKRSIRLSTANDGVAHAAGYDLDMGSTVGLFGGNRVWS